MSVNKMKTLNNLIKINYQNINISKKIRNNNNNNKKNKKMKII